MFSSLNDRFNIPPVISVASGKGGVGKSLISVGLARGFSARGVHVLLIDAATGLGNLHILTNTTPVYTLEDIIENSCSIRDAVVKISDDIDLLAAASGVRADDYNHAADNLRMKMAGLKSFYDLVIIDTPTGISDKTLSFASLADHLILTVTPELGSLADGYALLKLLNSRGGNRDHILVVNMVQSEKEGKSTAEKFSRMTERFLKLNLKHSICLPHDPGIKSIIMRQNLLDERREDCAFFEQLDAMIQNIFSKSVPIVVKGRNENKDTINPEIPLSSQTYTSDRRYVILHAGELENNIVNKKSQAQGKTLYES
jgi:flagellar biosynthesis protein FlhG